MKKSIYSVMLFDEIVDQIDRLAYLKKTNRSQMINDLLAAQLGMITPEQKIESVFNQISKSFSNKMIIDDKNSNNCLCLGKSLKYKYRPKVYYLYEFIGESKKKHAVLKIHSRTTSKSLNNHFSRFFKMINQIDLIENENQNTLPTNYMFIRSFPESSQISQDSQSISLALIKYLNMIDESMNYYFTHLDDKNVFDVIEKIYQNYYE